MTSDPAPAVFPLFFRFEPSAAWEFRGSAFLVAPRRFLTARHCVDWNKWDALKKPAGGVPDGEVRFNDIENRGEFSIAVPGKKGRVDHMPVTAIVRPTQDPYLDAAVLSVDDVPSSVPSAPVTWLDGLDPGELKRTKLEKAGIRARGYTKTSVPGNQWVEPLDMRWDNMAAPQSARQVGLNSFRFPDGGLPEGYSDCPVLVESEYGTFCIGIGWRGGLMKGPATALGSGRILRWLSQEEAGLHQQMPSLAAQDLPPEGAARQLKRVRDTVRQLLVPLLRDGATGRKDGGRGELTLNSEADFIRLFVCLHARPDVPTRDDFQAQGEQLRSEVERSVYDLFRSQRATFDPLPPYEDAVASITTSFHVKVIRAAVNRLTASGPQPPVSQQALSEVEANWANGVEVYLSLRLADGLERLVWRPLVWEALKSPPGAVLVGGAGSGKSTVAQFFALAMAVLEHRVRESKLRDLFSQAPHLRGRVPVFLRFRDLGENLRRLATVNSPTDAAETIAEVVRQACQVRGQTGDDSWPDAKGLVVIWDGLDELDTAARKSFASGLSAWCRGEGSGAFCLVTTRPTAYATARTSDEKACRIEGFPVWHIEKLDPMQQRQMVEGFLRAFGGEDVATRTTQVFEAVRTGQSSKLAEDPLMLAGLVRLAHERKKRGMETPLPGRQMGVLSELVDLMLHRWDDDKSGTSVLGKLAQALDACGRTTHWLRGILANLAWESLTRKKAGAFSRDRLEQELDRDISKGFGGVLKALDDHAGLIRPLEDVSSGERCFEFPDWSFRSFLAAEALSEKACDEGFPLPTQAPDSLKEARGKPDVFLAELGHHGLHAIVGDGTETIPNSREILQFAAALAVGQQSVQPYLVAWVRVAWKRRSLGLPAMPILSSAVDLTQDVGQWTYQAWTVPATWKRDRPYDVSFLVELAEAVRDSGAEDPADRVAAASLVGILSEAKDPGTGASKGTAHASDPLVWCRVGTKGRLRFWMGDEFHFGGGRWRCDLVRRPFYMSRRPISVAGFHQVGQPAGLTTSFFTERHPTWRLPAFQLPTHPVVGVDWPTATQWCDAATRLMRAGQWVGELPEEVRSSPSDWEIRLPEEWEWEFAARGPEAGEPPCDVTGLLRVPWGWATEEEIGSRVSCNYSHMATVPVDWQVEESRSWCGLEQMCGFVWEWCRTPWVEVEESNGRYPDDYAERAVRAEADTGVLRVLRGGSWRNLPRNCRCADRNAYPPGYRSVSVGFRPVLAPVPEAGRGG